MAEGERRRGGCLDAVVSLATLGILGVETTEYRVDLPITPDTINEFEKGTGLPRQMFDLSKMRHQRIVRDEYSARLVWGRKKQKDHIDLK